MLFTCYEYVIRNKQILTSEYSEYPKQSEYVKKRRKNTNNNKKQKHISISNVRQFDATFDKRDENI